MVIDSTTIITGSFNFTKAAEEKNAENLLVIKNAPELVTAYEATIRLHAAHAHPYQRRAAVMSSAVTPVRERGNGAVHGNKKSKIYHIPPDLVVRSTTTHRKPPDVRICRLRNQSRVGTVPPSTSTPHCPACWARR
jgi:phosphatidylserine/phosphatidylglycerophosphate/cardiolipin synthase-like enzyme